MCPFPFFPFFSDKEYALKKANVYYATGGCVLVHQFTPLYIQECNVHHHPTYTLRHLDNVVADMGLI
jgi:hypothetical protein